MSKFSARQERREELLSTIRLFRKSRQTRFDVSIHQGVDSDDWKIAYAAGRYFADDAALRIQCLGGMAGEW